MNRRDTISALCALVTASSPALAFAQASPAVRRRIGMLSENRKRPSGECPVAPKDAVWSLVNVLKKQDLIEGQHFVLERRCSDGHPERLPELARELVNARVDVIAAYGTEAVLAAKGATDRIPIVMTMGPDPIAQGWARSYNRPGGNLTGFTFEIDQTDSVLFKVLEFARDAIPNVRRGVVVKRAKHPMARMYSEANMRVAERLGIALLEVDISNAEGIEKAFGKIRELKADALAIAVDSFMFVHAKWIMDEVVKTRLPAALIGPVWTMSAFPGALFCLFPDVAGQAPRAAEYVARILKGVKPADLPIQRPDRISLVVDLTVARRLGIKIPESVLLRASKIIE